MKRFGLLGFFMLVLMGTADARADGFDGGWVLTWEVAPPYGVGPWCKSGEHGAAELDLWSGFQKGTMTSDRSSIGLYRVSINPIGRGHIALTVGNQRARVRITVDPVKGGEATFHGDRDYGIVLFCGAKLTLKPAG